MDLTDLLTGDGAQTLLVVSVMGVLGGMVGKAVTGFLKRTLKLKGRRVIQPIAGLVCAALAATLCASVGLLTWGAVPVTIVIAWLYAEDRAKADEETPA